jgi:hypothetical protein
VPEGGKVSIAHVIGVDPGLVHTGVVSLMFGSRSRQLEIQHTVVNGPDAPAVAGWIQGLAHPKGQVYVEAYRTRQNLNSDQRMMQAEVELRAALRGARFLPNMGIKRVITADLLRLLEVWRFPTATHHHDLRAAARIALLGMVKDGETNTVLATVVRDHLDGTPWSVTHV